MSDTDKTPAPPDDPAPDAPNPPPPPPPPPPPSAIFSFSSFEFPGRRTRGGGIGGFASSIAVAGAGAVIVAAGPESAEPSAEDELVLGSLVLTVGLSGGVLKSVAVAEALDLTEKNFMSSVSVEESSSSSFV